MIDYRTVDPRHHTGELSLPYPCGIGARTVSLDSSASTVMIDLRQACPVPVDENAPVAEALKYILHTDSGLAFALDHEQRLSGLITVSDIQGEAPFRHLQSIGCTHTTCSMRDVMVKDILEPAADWRTVDLRDLAQATVGHIVSAFHQSGRKHILVIESGSDNADPCVCGILSVSRVERQLGCRVEMSPVASSFAAIESALMSHA